MRNPNPIFSSRSSERLLCAWALLDDRWLDDLPVALTRQHFQDDKFGALFEAIVAKRASGLRATPDTLESWASNGEIWTPDELYSLQGEGRSGSRSELEAAAHHIVTMAGGRSLIARLDDARVYVHENTEQDPSVLATNCEALIRDVATSTATRAVTIGEMSGDYLSELKAGQSGGIRCGLVDVDARHGSFQGGDLIIIAGEPGSGKTTIASNLARNFSAGFAPCFSNGRLEFRQINGGRKLRGHFASYEMGKGQIVPRMLSALSHLSAEVPSFEYNALRQENYGGVSFDTLDHCDAILKRDYAELAIDVTPAQTLAELEASVRRTKRDLGGLDYIIVDYLQRMRPTTQKADRHVQIGEISAGLKDLAQRHRVPVFALSTINRENQKRGDRRPQRSDMRESGQIEYDADIILATYRQARELELELRAMANDPDVDEVTFFTKEGELEKLKFKMELLTLKARQGEEGTDYLHVNLGVDTVTDGEKPRTGRRP